MILIITNMQTITIDTFNAFGKRHCTAKSYGQKIFNGMTFQSFGEAEKMFVEQCNKILDSRFMEVNAIMMNKLVKYLIQNGFESFATIIIEIFNDYTNKIGLYIQNEFETKTFTVGGLLKKYNAYMQNSNILKNCLNDFDQEVILENSKINYSYIQLIKSYTFYANVINKKYMDNDTMKYLYEILSNDIINNQNIDNLTSIFKIYQFYNKLSYIVKDNRDKYFNPELCNKLIIKDVVVMDQLLTMIINNINSSIKELATISIKETMEKKLEYIRTQITLGCNIANDKTTFMLMYRKSLTERLLLEATEPLIEKELLSSLNYRDLPEIYIKMLYQINDIGFSKKHNQYFQKMKVVNSTGKYTMDLTKLNIKNCKFTVMKSYGWDLTNTMIFQMPQNVSIYIDIFNAYYNDLHKDRNLICNTDKSTVIVKMTLLDKEYNIQMSLLQYLVINTINENGSICAIDIAKKLCITSLQPLVSVLNSLMTNKLVTRENGLATDPKLCFTLNKSCSFPSTNLSLIALHRDVKTPLQKTEQPSNATLKASILGILAHNSSINKEMLLDLVIKRTNNKNITFDMLEPIINDLIKVGRTSYIDGNYIYIKQSAAIIKEKNEGQSDLVSLSKELTDMMAVCDKLQIQQLKIQDDMKEEQKSLEVKEEQKAVEEKSIQKAVEDHQLVEAIQLEKPLNDLEIPQMDIKDDNKDNNNSSDSEEFENLNITKETYMKELD
jgi:hypothetical protein